MYDYWIICNHFDVTNRKLLFFQTVEKSGHERLKHVVPIGERVFTVKHDSAVEPTEHYGSKKLCHQIVGQFANGHPSCQYHSDGYGWIEVSAGEIASEIILDGDVVENVEQVAVDGAVLLDGS